MTQKLKNVLGRVENIVGKGENAGYQHFLLFPQCFLKLSFPEVLKVGIVWYWVKQTASIFPITCLGLVLQNVYQPIPNNHVILRPWKKRLLETLCEKEDWHFPPFRNLFCPVGELQIICIKVGNVSV